jgi:uncharacterized membrane protein YphA (DoxX/SURF4 family)
MASQAGWKKGIRLNRFFKAILNHSWIDLGARWILGLTFIYAGFHKIVSPDEFAKMIYGYNIFPHILINLIAIVVPFIEFITGLAIIIGVYPRSVAIIITGMLLVFIVLIAVNLIRGYEFDCGCFPAGDDGFFKSPTLTLFRDMFYFLLGLQVIFFNGVRKMIPHFSKIKTMLL